MGPEPDPNERSRARRRQARRRRRLRLAGLVAAGLALVAGTALALTLGGGGAGESRAAATTAAAVAPRNPVLARPRPLPHEIRGVHVTMALASLPGRLEEYLDVPGLNTIELDVKDEDGHVGFLSGAPALARATGAAARYYDARRAVRLVRRYGV